MYIMIKKKIHIRNISVMINSLWNENGLQIKVMCFLIMQKTIMIFNITNTSLNKPKSILHKWQMSSSWSSSLVSASASFPLCATESMSSSLNCFGSVGATFDDDLDFLFRCKWFAWVLWAFNLFFEGKTRPHLLLSFPDLHMK